MPVAYDSDLPSKSLKKKKIFGTGVGWAGGTKKSILLGML